MNGTHIAFQLLSEGEAFHAVEAALCEVCVLLRVHVAACVLVGLAADA